MAVAHGADVAVAGMHGLDMTLDVQRTQVLEDLTALEAAYLRNKEKLEKNLTTLDLALTSSRVTHPDRDKKLWTVSENNLFKVRESPLLVRITHVYWEESKCIAFELTTSGEEKMKQESFCYDMNLELIAIPTHAARKTVDQHRPFYNYYHTSQPPTGQPTLLAEKDLNIYRTGMRYEWTCCPPSWPNLTMWTSKMNSHLCIGTFEVQLELHWFEVYLVKDNILLYDACDQGGGVIFLTKK